MLRMWRGVLKWLSLGLIKTIRYISFSPPFYKLIYVIKNKSHLPIYILAPIKVYRYSFVGFRPIQYYFTFYVFFIFILPVTVIL